MAGMHQSANSGFQLLSTPERSMTAAAATCAERWISGQIHIYQLAATLQSSPRYEDVRDGAPAGVPNEGGGR